MLKDAFAAILGNDNAARISAEAFLNETKKSRPHTALMELSAILSESGEESYRSLAAVLLRGMVLRETTIWETLSPQDFHLLRARLLASLVSEKVAHVQRKIANTVAAHAKISNWPELMEGLVVLSSSSDPKCNELTLYLLDKLAEHVGPLLVANLDTVVSIIFPFLVEGRSLRLRTTASQALCSLISELPTVEDRLCSALNEVCSVLKATVGADDEVHVQDLLTSLSRLCREKPEMFVHCWMQLIDCLQSICISNNAQSFIDDIDDAAAVDGVTKVMALELYVSLFTSHKSAAFASNADTRSTLMNLCVKLMANIDDDNGGVALGSRPDEGEDGGFGDADGDGSDGNIADFAALCLDTLSKNFEPAEVVQKCLSCAWALASQNDWRARRAALFTISVICEGSREAVYPILSQLVPSAIRMLQDPHPRVRFSALHCLATLTSEFTGGADDDGDDNDGEMGGGGGAKGEHTEREKSFQETFGGIAPPAICAAIEANFAYPRIVFMGLSALKSFFNPQNCSNEICAPYSAGVLAFCLNLLAGSETPYFVKEECASVVGNVSVLSPPEVLNESRYLSLMTVLRTIVFSDLPSPSGGTSNRSGGGGGQYEISMLKAKCLECIALVGKAVGAAVFAPVAHEVLTLLVEAHARGLDYSDPLSSYIVQTSARIAGVMGDIFQPYVASFLPPLLSHIATETSIEVENADLAAATATGGGSAAAGGGGDSSTTEDSSSNSNISSANKSSEKAGGEVFTMYKRGVGNIRVVCNTHEIAEKETACRCLYQYTLDIPRLVWQYAPAMVDAAAPLLVSLVHQSEDMFLVVGAILADSVKTYLRHCDTFSDATITVANSMTDKSLRHLIAALERQQTIERSRDVEKGSTERIIESIGDSLKVRWDASRSDRHWPCSFAPDLVHELVVVLRDEAVIWIQRRYVDGSLPNRDDELEMEDEIWTKLIDALGWLIKLCGDSFQGEFMTELFPFINGLLKNEGSPAHLIMFPICVFMDAMEYMPQISQQCCEILAPSLLQYISAADVMIPCIYGLGVCAMHGGAPFEQHCPRAMAALLSVTGAVSQGDLGFEIDDEGVDMETAKDNAFSSLFKLAIFRGNLMGLEGASQILSYVLSNLPLTQDTSEAKDLHSIFVDLIAARDTRLLGPHGRLENLPVVLSILAQLVAVDDKGRVAEGIPGIAREIPPAPTDAEDDDFWSEQTISAVTLTKARQTLRSGLSPTGLPIEVINAAMQTIPSQVQNILKLFASY